MASLTVGLLSDTHVPYRLKRLPEAALDALTGVDVILHAGDVDDPAALEPLYEIAPVYAVRGNVHFMDFSDGGASLPAAIELQLVGSRVVLTHGHRPGLLSFWFKGWDMLARWLNLGDRGIFNRRLVRRLVRLYPQADIIVFGHSHRAYAAYVGDILLVNPGAVCPTRGAQGTSVARMMLGEGPPKVTIVPLEAPAKEQRT